MSKRLYDDTFTTNTADTEHDPKRANLSLNDNETIDSAKPDLSTNPDANNNDVVVGCGFRQGVREQMEDRHIVQTDYRPALPACMIKRSAFFGIFDGHAGSKAAEFCGDNFGNIFSEFCRKYATSANDFALMEKSVKKIFIDSFKMMDDKFLQLARSSRPPLKDGTTATILFLLNDTLYAANIGDSKAILCRRKPDSDRHVPLVLTIDHHPMIFDERQRIQKCGGFVRDGRVQGIIEVSRSIGDSQFKKFGLTCLPDVKKVTLNRDDKFVILACDGLWKVITPEQAIEFILKEVAETSLSTEGRQDLKFWNFVADKLSVEAVKRGCGDNVSVILIVFKDAVING